MRSRRPLAVALLVSVLLAGCQAPATTTTGPSPTDTGASTATGRTATATAATATPAPAPPTPNVTVRNGSLPVDPGAVFARMQAVLGTNATPPAYVEVVDDPDMLAPGAGGELPRVWRLLGIRPGGVNESRIDRLENGVTTGLGGIRLYLPGNASPATAEWLLAHEFVHYVYVQQGIGIPLAQRLPRTTDAQGFVRRAMAEGAAVYATDAYIARYGLDAPPNSRLYRDLRPAIADGSAAQYVNDAYIAGHRYVAARADSPRDVPAVFNRSPTTSEQLLHGYAPDAEPPAPLTVRADGTGGWRAVGRDTLGEAFLRTMLDRTLPGERATRAAAGWGNDSLAVFRHPDRRNASYVWVLRWDDRANATSFQEAVRDHFDARGDPRGDARWRIGNVTAAVRRPADRTVVVVVGARAFVEGVTLTTDGATVRVRAA